MKEEKTVSNKKNWYIASICLTIIMMGILFYFFTANITSFIGLVKEVNIVLTPIYAGALLAFLLLPIHEYFFVLLKNKLPIENKEKRSGLSNGLATFISLIIAFSVIYLLLAMILPQVYISIENLFQSMPSDITLSTPVWLTEFFNTHPDVYEKVYPYYESGLISLNDWVQNDVLPSFNSLENIMAMTQFVLPNITGVVSGVSTVVVSLFGFIADSLVAIIVSVYLLARKKTFAAQSKKLVYAFLPVNWADLVLDEFRNAYKIMSGFINGKLLDSLIIGIIAFIGSTILKFPYAILIATIIGITNIIPFFGPFIGGVPCGILIFLVSPIKCLYFIVFIVALQQFDGNILGPKILGESTGLGSFWVLFSIILFGGMLGLPGMLLGVPVFATFYSIMSRLIKYLLMKKNMPVETDVYEEQDNIKKNMNANEIVEYAKSINQMGLK